MILDTQCLGMKSDWIPLHNSVNTLLLCYCTNG